MGRANGDARIAREKATITVMIRIYCRGHHGDGDPLCAACVTLLDYAQRRLDGCPFQAAKPACNRCEVHCYSARMRERVRSVMRYAGPRMLWRSPRLSLWHMLDKLRRPPVLVRRSQARPRRNRSIWNRRSMGRG